MDGGKTLHKFIANNNLSMAPHNPKITKMVAVSFQLKYIKIKDGIKHMRSDASKMFLYSQKTELNLVCCVREASKYNS